MKGGDDMDHLETIEKELKDVLIRYLKALAPEPGADNQLEELQDLVSNIECKVEDIEERLDNASLDI
jgi:uncharacterized protein YihD (DUF1040 family)